MALGSAIGTGVVLRFGRCHQNGGSKRVVGLYYRWYRGVYSLWSLGEMSVHNPAASSFSRYAQENLSH
ncbi:hypothetical protein ACNKHN_01835 [Shigella flexneri]